MGIWDKIKGLFGKKKPVDEIQDFKVLQLVAGIPKTDEVEKDALVQKRQHEQFSRKVFDTTGNPNKYWRRFKRGDHYYWKKFYHG